MGPSAFRAPVLASASESDRFRASGDNNGALFSSLSSFGFNHNICFLQVPIALIIVIGLATPFASFRARSLINYHNTRCRNRTTQSGEADHWPCFWKLIEA